MKTKFKPDTLETVKNTDLVQLSRALLDSVVENTNALSKKKMTPERLKEMKMVLGYLTATTSTVKAKMSYFRMIGLGEKVREVKKLTER